MQEFPLAGQVLLGLPTTPQRGPDGTTATGALPPVPVPVPAPEPYPLPEALPAPLTLAEPPPEPLPDPVPVAAPPPLLPPALLPPPLFPAGAAAGAGAGVGAGAAAGLITCPFLSHWHIYEHWQGKLLLMVVSPAQGHGCKHAQGYSILDSRRRLTEPNTFVKNPSTSCPRTSGTVIISETANPTVKIAVFRYFIADCILGI